jgi:hypothetical protein
MDVLQKRLKEMEEENPSRNKHEKGLVGTLVDKWNFCKRDNSSVSVVSPNEVAYGTESYGSFRQEIVDEFFSENDVHIPDGQQKLRDWFMDVANRVKDSYFKSIGPYEADVENCSLIISNADIPLEQRQEYQKILTESLSVGVPIVYEKNLQTIRDADRFFGPNIASVVVETYNFADKYGLDKNLCADAVRNVNWQTYINMHRQIANDGYGGHRYLAEDIERVLERAKTFKNKKISASQRVLIDS